MILIGRRENGDTLVEVILAIALMSLVLVGSFNIIGAAYRTAMLSKERIEAVSLAQQQAERLRKLRDDQQAAEVAFSAMPFPATGQTLDSNLDTVNCPADGCLVNGLYKVRIEKISNISSSLDPILNSYLIRVRWIQAGTNDTNETQILFKLADRDPSNIERDCAVVESCS